MSSAFISLICPTHKRPALQERFAKSAYDNCYDGNNVDIIFAIDSDDVEAIKTADSLKSHLGEEKIVVKIVNPGEKLSNIANLCASDARGEILGQVADDVIIRSTNWDSVVREAFQLFDDKIMLLWSDDGLWNGELASHTFVHKNWLKALGYISPPYFVADWADKWNQEIAMKIHRGILVPDRSHLFLEHMHVEAGKMEKDETHLKGRERASKQNGVVLYNTPELTALRNEDCMKLIRFIKEFHEQKVSTNSG